MMVLAMTAGTCTVAAAAENPSATRNALHSNGAFRYSQGEGSVVIDSADLYTLADRLDLFKVRAAKQLEAMQTYLTRDSGGVALTGTDGVYAVHSRPSAGQEIDPLTLDFAAILEGIAVSQSIPADPAAYGMAADTQLYKTPEGKLVTTASEGAEPVSIQAASAENLSAGMAAWVNGSLLLGTGEDTADAVSKKPDTELGGELTAYSISSEYTLPEDVAFAVAYVSNALDEGNDSAATPAFTVNGSGKYYRLVGKSYGSRGYNVKVGVYYLTNLSAGTLIRGSNGVLFY